MSAFYSVSSDGVYLVGALDIETKERWRMFTLVLLVVLIPRIKSDSLLLWLTWTVWPQVRPQLSCLWSTGVVFTDSIFSLLCKVLSICPLLVCHPSVLITLTPYSLIFYASHFNVSFFLTAYSWAVVILSNTCLSLVILIYQLFSSW